MREHHTAQTLNAWLDTPGGLMLSAQYGSRQAAAAALAEGERFDHAWRRAVAEDRAERYPERYASVADAMRDVPDPVGGCGATLAGDVDDIVAATRHIDPTRGIRNLGGELPDGAVEGISLPPGRPVAKADTRPPWQRGD